eukprot:gene5003-6988_t
MAESTFNDTNKKTSAIETKMTLMREKFKMLQLAEEGEDEKKDTIDTSVHERKLKKDQSDTSVHNKQTPTAASRWDKVRRVIKRASFGDATMQLLQPNAQSNNKASPEPVTTKDTIELEDIELSSYWDKLAATNFFVDEEKEGLEFKPSLHPIVVSPIDEEFMNESRPLGLTVAKIPESVVRSEQERAELQNLEQQRKIIETIKRKEADVIWREHIGRERVMKLESEVKAKSEIERQKISEDWLDRELRLGEEFRKVREKLEDGIRQQQAAISESYGQVLIHEESIARRYFVFTKLIPQPIEFRIHLMRAVKSKLPKGAYVMMLTQYDSLGGKPLNWSKIGATGIGNKRPGITSIFKHPGRYFDRTLRVEDSVFALCPPRPLLKPSFTFVLELFELSSRHNPVDRVVAWTALPMCFESMSLVEGKIKLPLLKGEHSPNIQHFKSMESEMSKDLNNWLCNIYIEIRSIPMVELGFDEKILKSNLFDLDFFNKSIQESELSSIQNHHMISSDKDNNSNKKKGNDFDVLDSFGNDHLRNNNSNNNNLEEGRGLLESYHENNNEDDEEDSDNSDESDDDIDHKYGNNYNNNSNKTSIFNQVKTMIGLTHKKNSVFPIKKHHKRSQKDDGSVGALSKDESFFTHRSNLIKKWKENIKKKTGKGYSSDEELEEIRERGYNIPDEEMLHEHQRGKLAGLETIGTREGRQWASSGLEGRIVRRYQSDGPRFDSEAISQNGSLRVEESSRGVIGLQHGNSNNTNMISKQNSLASLGVINGVGTFNSKKVSFQQSGNAQPFSVGWQPLKDPREMESYSVSIAADMSKMKQVIAGSIAKSKLRYLSLELFGDFAPYLIGSFGFYMSLIIYSFAFWMRIYVHYMAEYLYLQSLGTPVYSFRLQVLFVIFKYSSVSISTSSEVGVVAIGPIANVCVFLLMAILGGMFYKISRFLPDSVSKFIAAFGVASTLDPILTTLIDVCYHHYSCSQYSHSCEVNKLSDNCACYDGSIIFSILILYEYLIRIHRDGRILDIYRRINGVDGEFFIPHDYEISFDELMLVCRKAATYKSPLGSKRKVSVIKGIENDPEDVHYQEPITRYIIYDIDATGRSVIFRQFMKNSEGMILEIFQDFNNNNFNNNNNNNKIENNGIKVDSADPEEVVSMLGESPRSETWDNNNNNNMRENDYKVKPPINSSLIMDDEHNLIKESPRSIRSKNTHNSIHNNNNNNNNRMKPGVITPSPLSILDLNEIKRKPSESGGNNIIHSARSNDSKARIFTFQKDSNIIIPIENNIFEDLL